MTVHPEVDLLYQMVRIHSPSRQEDELAGFLAGRCRELGLRSVVDEVGNLVAETGTGHGPTILLLGHLDTVDDPIPAQLYPDRVTGRGAVDAKGPLAAMLSAAAERPDFPGRLIVAGAVEEECPGSLGATHLRSTLDQPDVVVVGEPSGWSTVVLGYKGILDLRYQVRRSATHPTNPAEKATEAAAAFWADAVAVLGPEASHAAFDRPAVTLSRMTGDLTEAQLDFSYRLPLGFDAEALLQQLRDLARGGSLDVLGRVPAVRTDRGNPVVRALNTGIRRAGGIPRHKLKTATSDMNVMAEVWDVPMATYGPGDSQLDHSADEHILIDDYLRGAAVLVAALDELALRAGASRERDQAYAEADRLRQAQASLQD
jgi:[amino group carrier protein]-lysine/ornithine hydrolase